MIKKYVPGRIYNIHGTICRAKRATNLLSCKGCLFDNMFSCPNIWDKRTIKEYITCKEDGVIFIKPASKG